MVNSLHKTHQIFPPTQLTHLFGRAISPEASATHTSLQTSHTSGASVFIYTPRDARATYVATHTTHTSSTSFSSFSSFFFFFFFFFFYSFFILFISFLFFFSVFFFFFLFFLFLFFLFFSNYCLFFIFRFFLFPLPPPSSYSLLFPFSSSSFSHVFPFLFLLRIFCHPFYKLPAMQITL